MYGGCGIPGCSMAFDRCQIHHLKWFRNNGLTDINNLLPLCNKHHHLVHEGGWHLSLDSRRDLTVTFPDGSIMTTGPPSAWAQ